MRTVREGGDPFGSLTWFLSDYLGSTNLTVSESGGVLAEAKYTPWGDQRKLAGDLPTDYGYTGQREESALGLMYYVARWYDSGIGHFVQADTVVPGAGNPAAWNRYAYVMYNPLRYVDPSGHLTDDQIKKYANIRVLGIENLSQLKEQYSELYAFLQALQFGDDLIAYDQGEYSVIGKATLDESGDLAFEDESGNIVYLENVLTAFSVGDNQTATFALERRINGRLFEFYYGDLNSFHSKQPNTVYQVDVHEEIVDYWSSLIYKSQMQSAEFLPGVGTAIDLFGFFSPYENPGTAIDDEVTTILYTDEMNKSYIAQEIIIRNSQVLINRMDILYDPKLPIIDISHLP